MEQTLSLAPLMILGVVLVGMVLGPPKWFDRLLRGGPKLSEIWDVRYPAPPPLPQAVSREEFERALSDLNKRMDAQNLTLQTMLELVTHNNEQQTHQEARIQDLHTTMCELLNHLREDAPRRPR